ncbi:MAG: UDP-N-acetylmuramoyl-L-alanine--D-glutamate ligase [Hyphomicrobiaceae bacterium]|nr:UDP-N-acetylmuramoyl-L-alanine--D-glutamate ligase [Hyphomicrobiaceae bacterium]
MIPISTMSGRRVAVFGLGLSGRATAAALQAGGAVVSAWDDNEASRTAFAAEGGPVADLRDADWPSFAALVLAPGVPLTHPKPHWTVEAAKAAGVPVIGDVELFARERQALCPAAPFVAITGTNGKSTTTALIAHILRAAGRDVQMGGNIGVPILALEPPARDRVHVIELSSYQVDLMPTLTPTIGVLLNLSPDHIDRHGSMDNYAAIKARVPLGAGLAVIGMDDRHCREIAADVASRGGDVLPIWREPSANGIYPDSNRLMMRDATTGGAVAIADVAGIGSLRGAHNAQNAAAAAAVGLRLELTPAEVQAGLASFPGLAHRMEQCGRRGRVLFINDSKATNADSAEKALSSFDGGIFWIAGGLAKEGGIAPLAEYFGRVEKAYLIGAAAGDFAATLEGHAAYVLCGTLDAAVAAAAEDAACSDAREPVVLLSPACASFDQFRSFEARGTAFKAAVAALDGLVSPDPAKEGST